MHRLVYQTANERRNRARRARGVDQQGGRRGRAQPRPRAQDAVRRLARAKSTLPSSLKDDDLVANLNELEKTMFDNHKCTLVELSPDYWKHFALVTASSQKTPWYVVLPRPKTCVHVQDRALREVA